MPSDPVGKQVIEKVPLVVAKCDGYGQPTDEMAQVGTVPIVSDEARPSLPDDVGELVERVAKAITESFAKGSPDIAANMRMDWQTWEPEARAAIEASGVASYAERVRILEDEMRELRDVRNIILASTRDVTVGDLLDLFGWQSVVPALKG